MNKIRVIDPLKIKLQDNIIKGNKASLNKARQFGTKKDVNRLLAILLRLRKEDIPYIYIDLTPFERIGGDVDFFVSNLLKFKNNNSLIPVLMITEELLDGLISESRNFDNIISVVFDSKGDFVKITGDELQDKNLKKKIVRVFKTCENNNDSTLLNFRRAISNDKLIDLLFSSDAIEIPKPNEKRLRKLKIVKLGSKYYISMENGMLVNKYLNLKHFGNRIDFLSSVAYEIILLITEYFRRDLDVLNSFDYIVTTNNTTLFLTSLVEVILDKPIIAIDKLGPIPRFSIHTDNLIERLENKNIVLIEEVVAAGNELDRAILFLNNLKANISKIVAIYNLEVGSSMLAKKYKMISLCKPKDKINYEYRSKFS